MTVPCIRPAICELNHPAAPQSSSFVSLPFRGACCKRAACTPFRYRARGQRVDAQFFSFSRAWACSQQRAVCNRATAASPRLTVLPCSRVSLSRAPGSAGMSHVRLHRHRRLRAPASRRLRAQGQRGCQKRRHRPTRPSRAQRRRACCTAACCTSRGRQPLGYSDRPGRWSQPGSHRPNPRD